MRIWKNTTTLNGYDNGLIFTDTKDEAEIALLGSKPIALSEFPKLKGIFRVGIGRDNVPVKEAESKGILVRFPSKEIVDIIYEETANFTCSLIFRMLYTEVGTLDPWFKHDRLQLSDKKLLIIGTGNIGSRVADKMRNFMKLETYDILTNTPGQLSEMLRKVDCVSLHIPNNPENKAFFNKERLSIMKDGSVIINTARGAIVNEDALYNEISKGRLKAAFDVYWKEPYEGKLKEFHPEKFHMTPHVASTCIGFLEGCRNDLNNLIKKIKND